MHRLMELIGERQSLWLHHTRCNCTETLRRNRDIPFFRSTCPRRGKTIKTIEATFQLGSFEIYPFFLFILPWHADDHLPSRFLNIFYFFSFLTRVERQFESRIREDRVFKGIKGRTVEGPPVEISMNRIAVSACLLSTSHVPRCFLFKRR